MNPDQIAQLANAFRQFAASNAQPNQPQQIAALPDFEQFAPSEKESGKFSRWFSRFQHFMALHCADWDDQRKISLLMTKLNGQAYEEFESSLLPGKVADIDDFDGCLAKLRELFDAKRTLFLDRYQALQVQIQEGEDMRTLANRVKRMVADFDFANFTEENLKTMLFLLALKPKKYGKVRTRLIQTLQNEPNRKLDELVADCNLYLSATNLMVEDGQHQKGNAGGQKGGKKAVGEGGTQQQQQTPVTVVVNQHQQQQHHQQQRPTGPPPPNYICTYCSGPGHWKWHCPKRVQAPPPASYICQQCNTKGHWKWECPARNAATGGQQRQGSIGPLLAQQQQMNGPKASKKAKGKKEGKNDE